jgi:hypothetical protein
VNATRVTLLASALLGTLALAAAALAAPSPDDGATSGGARVIPVVPSEGGGSEALDGSTAPEIVVPPPVAVPPVQQAPAAPQAAPDGLVLPLQGLSADPAPESSEPPAEQGASSGGGFSFLATTGLEIVSVVIALLRSAAG